MSDPAANDPGESQRRWARRLMRLQIARELTPNRVSEWLTASPQPGIRWYRINNRTHRVEIRREG